MHKSLLTSAFYIIVCILSLNAQTTIQLSKEEGLYTKTYSVLQGDTSIYHGPYKMYYKDKIIENGTFKNGIKVGNWQYFSFNSIFDFSYNYDQQKIEKISADYEFDLNTYSPCFFLGSPIIPYLYLVTNLSYPEKAMELNLSGRVILSLRIDARGNIYGFYISQKLHPLLDKAVMNVASQMPKNWKFVPATQNNQPCDSEYQIPIEFEIDE